MLGLISIKKHNEKCNKLIEKNDVLEKKYKILNEQYDNVLLENERLNSEIKNSRKISFDLNGQVLNEKHKLALADNEIKEQKKIIQKLKAICTKNGIDYKHLIRKGK